MKRIIPILFALFFITQISYAQDGSLSMDTIRYKIDSLNKKIDSLRRNIEIKQQQAAKEISLKEAAKKNRNDSFPFKPIGWTNDFENILTNEQVLALDSMLVAIVKETTIEIAIITIDSSYIGKNDFDSLVTAIGNSWGVGKAGKDNGIVIGICSSLKKIRISNGYGIEAKLSDTETKKIIDEVIIPKFKQRDYFGGLKNALIAIIGKLY